MSRSFRLLAAAITTTLLVGVAASAVEGKTAPRHQRPPRHQHPVRRYPPPLLGPVIASWYWITPGESDGCGFHAVYGVATSIVPCGGRLRICNGARCVIAVRDDSPGPAVAANGRTFDLSQTTRAALACSDLCAVHYQILPSSQ